MPELPEVEVTRLTVAPRIEGAHIVSAWVGKPLRWPLGVAPGALAGCVVREVARRGKYLLLHLDAPGGGAGEAGVLLVHLGMSGSLSFQASPPARGPHDHFDLLTSRGVLRLHDPRRFGAVVWSAGAQVMPARKLLARLGVEPLGDGFDAVAFHQALRTRRAPIKQVLLAGDVVVGVGNIYACEVLFLARIRPGTPAARLSLARAARLHAAIRDVLGRAVAQGGTTLRDFSNALGESGHFQHQTAVYGRAGLPCPACGAPVRVMRQGQRSTYYCAHCQRP
ncbi:MAG: bifunctional DNA-formamidopyrimidine glycosylase/DNA-(apurinic or apyrimidinic site) lyase [Pseudomonadota bacterium]|nr:bifunctional DNA-formamidopyrimidine glycosylase/DNA-(apurinic or apyrimidinic site) lyase [Pseudomonadota bacterium]